MPDPFEPRSELLEVADTGISLVANTTQFLSTLPHPIEVIEELVSVCSVTSSLLKTLNCTICRFEENKQLCPKISFISLLCCDILSAFNEFQQKVSEAKSLRVFEPNDVGLVRVPRNAWIFVMGSEARMVRLRSRLYVEKYRVRVLIDAVFWQGLRNLGPFERTAEQDRELEALRKMLPVIAERMMGVWRDYKLRISSGDEKVPPKYVLKTIKATEQKKAPAFIVGGETQDDLKKDSKISSGKNGIHPSPSTTSIASSGSDCSTSSSVTAIDDSVLERWVLRCTESKRTLSKKVHIIGIPIKSTYTCTPAQYNMLPHRSHPSEIEESLESQAREGGTTAAYKAILKLPQEAQIEIEKLVERRTNASSNDNIQHSFKVVAFLAHHRNKISNATTGGSWKFWKKGGPVQWVLVLRGETRDRKPRTVPNKNDNPWEPKPREVLRSEGAPRVAVQNNRGIAQQQTMAAQMVGRPGAGVHMLRHVEQRRGVSVEEAEKGIAEMMGDLMKFGKGETRKDEVDEKV